MILDVPYKMLITMQGIINKFVWNNERPQINTKIMQRKMESGGLDVPNIV